MTSLDFPFRKATVSIVEDAAVEWMEDMGNETRNEESEELRCFFVGFCLSGGCGCYEGIRKS